MKKYFVFGNEEPFDYEFGGETFRTLSTLSIMIHEFDDLFSESKFGGFYVDAMDALGFEFEYAYELKKYIHSDESIRNRFEEFVQEFYEKNTRQRLYFFDTLTKAVEFLKENYDNQEAVKDYRYAREYTDHLGRCITVYQAKLSK